MLDGYFRGGSLPAATLHPVGRNLSAAKGKPMQTTISTTEPGAANAGSGCHCSPNSATGPKSASGKAISSRNAVTHGLRARKIENAVSPQLRAEYEKLRRQYLDEYHPTGAIESTLLDMVVFAAWQLYKIREMELWQDIDLGSLGSFGRSEKLARYRASHERLMFRSLNQLRQIQQERALQATDRAAALPTQIAPGIRLKPLFDHLKSLHLHPKTRSANATSTFQPAKGRERRERVPQLRQQTVQLP